MIPSNGNDEWEGGQRDFHWRSVNEHKSPPRAYPLSFEVYGEVASILYNYLNVNTQDERWGPLEMKVKVGSQIWCSETSTGDRKCSIGFELNGHAFPDHR
jgi:hypothetical protein